MENNFKNIMNNQSVCGLKWAWSTIRLQLGLTDSCHRTAHDVITPDTFHTFHNTPIKIETRKTMLAGQWPNHGCEYCKHIENAGGISDRIVANETIVDEYLPQELINNRVATHVSPSIIEVYFNNLCNMSCIYCSAEYSTVWEQENIKFNDYTDLNFIKIGSPTYTAMVTAFFQWLDTNILKIKELHVLGGEPFFQLELEVLLEFLRTHPNPKLNLKIFSNLKIAQPKLIKILAILDSFIVTNTVESVELILSIDCWDKQQEYIRTGLSISQWENNFSFIMKNYQNIIVHIHSTISNLAIPTIVGLIEKLNHYNTFRPTNPAIYSSDFIVHPKFLSPTIFPAGYFDQNYDAVLDIVQDSEAADKVAGYKKTINYLPYKPDLIVELVAYLDKLDVRRNTNWRTVFPWLNQFVIDNNLITQ